MEVLFIFVFALLGFAVGSFLNVCIDRLPRDESILNPPSHCQVCQHRLMVKELIPVFSYLWLHGRCRYCHASIPKRLLWVEVASGGLFAFLYLSYNLRPELDVRWLGVMAFYTCLFILICVVDLEHGLILNRVVYPGMAVALLFALFLPQPWIGRWPAPYIANAAMGGVVGFVLFLLTVLISRGGMGWGDVKLAALIGLATGFPLVFLALIMAAILGALAAVALLIAKRRGRKEAIPFGPFLSLGTLITLLWGSSILNWYLGLM